MPGEFDASRETNLIEYMASLFGFARLSAAIPRIDIYPPYLFIGFFTILDLAVLQVYVHLTGGTHILLEAPNTVAGYIAVFLGVAGTRYLARGYEDAMAAIRLQDRIDGTQLDQFRQTVRWRTKVTIYATGVLILYANTVVNVGVPARVTAINFLFTWEFVFLPVIVEFALTYYGIHVRLPRQIKRVDIELFFYDPRNMGGFGAVGNLLKRSYYLYTAGLLLFFVLVYGPVLFSFGGYVPGVFELVFFTAAWVVGLLSIGHSMHTIHQFMSTQKEARIRELEDELHAALEKLEVETTAGLAGL
jgi:hypothetical protein